MPRQSRLVRPYPRWRAGMIWRHRNYRNGIRAAKDGRFVLPGRGDEALCLG